MTFVGVDLAWGERARTGLCVVSAGRVLDSRLVRTFDEILAWISPRTTGPCLVAIDAPLVVVEPHGRRPCEDAIGRWMGAREAAAHSSNTSNPSFANGTRAGGLAAALDLEIDPHFAPGEPLRRAIEVYPHPALVALFDLPRSLKYKAKRGRTLESRVAAFRVLTAHLERLRRARPPLETTVGNPRWTALMAALRADGTIECVLAADLAKAQLPARPSR
jgi:predicted RNase H-like nuclease